MRLKLAIISILVILIFAVRNSSKKSLVNDPRFKNGREYGTGKPIQPKTFRFAEHLFILGHSGEASTLGMFKGKKELVFLASPDGYFDSVAQAELNNDGLADYLVFEKFDDGTTITSLSSVTVDSFRSEVAAEITAE